MKRILFRVIAIVTLLFAGKASAQISHGGTPLFNHSQSKVMAEGIYLSSLNNQVFLDEDLRMERGASPMRIGVFQECDVDVLSDAKVVKDAEGQHFIMSVSSPNASFMSLVFDRYELPDGAELFVYDRSGDFVLGSFNASDALDDGTFQTQSIPGDLVFVEYNVPAGIEPGMLHIDRVCHGYKDIFKTIESVYDDAEAALKGAHGIAEGNCHINVVCPDGDDWRDQIRSVVAIEIRTNGGSYMCSGALINNTRQDKTPYVLSAYHCQEEDEIGPITNFITYFGYQTTTCEGNSGPSNRSISGAERVAKYTYNGGSDFLLLRLNRDVPQSYNPYYAGWDRQNVASHSAGIAIHHPGGDYKKLSFPKTITRGTGQFSKFYIVGWYTGTQNKGTTEQGSSGSPIFNSDKRIVGQLYAGRSACDNTSGVDYYGRLFSSWVGNSNETGCLSVWLDPDGTGVNTLDGLDGNSVGIDVAEKTQFQSLKVYPNPSEGHIRFDVDALGDANYKVFDMNGRCVREGRTVLTVTAQAVDLSMLPKGSYVLQLFTSTHRYSTTVIIK